MNRQTDRKTDRDSQTKKETDTHRDRESWVQGKRVDWYIT